MKTITNTYKDFKSEDKSYLFKFYNETTILPEGDFIMFNAFVNIENGQIKINVRCVSDSNIFFSFPPYNYSEFIQSQVEFDVESISYEEVAPLIKEFIINQLKTNLDL